MTEVTRIPKPIKRQSAKRKGWALETKVAKMLDGKRMPGSGAMGGGDVVATGFSIECKKRKSLPALLIGAFSQAERDIVLGDNRKPLVVIEQDRGRPIACLYLEDLITKLSDQGPENAHTIRQISKTIKRLAQEIEDHAT